MRFQKLTIHNIASIEQAVIDFEAQPLAGSEVFLITGQTGAGKSTILDAICLALYAKTPRLANTKMQGETHDSEHQTVKIDDPRQLMRRNTADAFVTLTFTGSNGIHYEARWGVTRARKKVTGNMQAKEWQLTNLDSEHVLTKDREIQTEIQAAIGLDFNQFCRTTMLAQGEFTRFLNSKDDEKAEILEKITGVDIYSKIGAKVFAVTAEQEQAWRMAQQLVEGTETLTDEQIAEQQSRIAELQMQQQTLKNVAERAREKRERLIGVARAEQTKAQQQEVLARLQGQYNTLIGSIQLEQQQTELKQLENRIVALNIAEMRQNYTNTEVRRVQIVSLKSLIHTLETEQKQREKRRQMLIERHEALEKKKVEAETLSAPLAEAAELLSQHRAALDKQRDTVDSFAKTLRLRLHPGDVCPVCRQQIQHALPMEEELLAMIRPLEEAFATAEKHYNDLNAQVVRLRAEIAAETATLQKDKQSYELDKTLQTLRSKVVELGGTLSLNSADELAISQLEKLEQECIAQAQHLSQQIKEGEILEAEAAQRRKTLDDNRNQMNTLQEKMTAATTLIRTAEQTIAQLASHRDEMPELTENDTPESLTLFIQSNEKEQNAISEKKGALLQMLKNDAENKIRKGTLIEDADKKRTIYQRWARLNMLVGDAKGNKFRKIAQSYVLSSLIRSANSYMKTLSDRYTLRVAPGTFVIMLEDAYQGYVSRAASTISGGESFLVSLSLALALSDIGQTLSVDALFIDEGFGSLSGAPLQSAIDTLRSLHTKAGRHVGIISHVEELQERIPVQIQVNREGNNSACSIRVVGTH